MISLLATVYISTASVAGCDNVCLNIKETVQRVCVDNYDAVGDFLLGPFGATRQECHEITNLVCDKWQVSCKTENKK